MKPSTRWGARWASLLVIAATLAGSVPARACAVCFGKTDSPLGKGLHWGVLALLAFVFLMLTAFGAFAVYLARRAAAIELEDAARTGPPSPTDAP